jgi:putative redox protein
VTTTLAYVGRMEPPDVPAESDERRVDIVRTAPYRFTAINSRGGQIAIGPSSTSDFTPVELLLAAIVSCGGIDLDLVTRRRSEPDHFVGRAEATKVRDELGNRLVDIRVTFDLRFPEGDDGDAARAIVPRTIQQISDRLCTVSRTVEVGTPVALAVGRLDDAE